MLTANPNDARRLPRPTTVEIAAIGALVVLGLRLGLRSISDNSMLLHIRTGVDMVRSGHIPRTDPYSFTALGHAWVVQSWFAELTYGVANRLGGLHAVVFEQGLLMAVLALVIGLLARTDKAAATVVGAGVSVLAGITLWSSRPLLFGLLGMALLIFVVERRRSPLWLLPVVWIWVNTHGSFPLALVWLGGRYVGLILDERRRPRWLEPYVAALVGGLVLSVVNPLGPRLLSFPIVVEARHKVFQQIIEWRSPNFQSSNLLIALAFFSLGLIILIRRRGLWGDSLLVVAFLASGLVAQRNLAVAAVVMAPALARALTSGPTTDAPTGDQAPTRRPTSLPPVALPALVIAALILTVTAMRATPVDLKIYPTQGEAFLSSAGLLHGHRIAAPDIVGDYREYVENPRGTVFIDDRYDMYPASVVYDSEALAAGEGPALDVIRRWNIDVVLWGRGQGPTALLHTMGGWRLAWSDAHWEILVRDPHAPSSKPL